MSLSFSFNLTPSQTRLLLRVRFEEQLREPGRDYPPYIGDPAIRDLFTPAQALKRKGLIEHRMNAKDGRPNYICTPEGVVMADLIVRDAREVVRIAESGGEWKPAAVRKGKADAR